MERRWVCMSGFFFFLVLEKNDGLSFFSMQVLELIFFCEEKLRIGLALGNLVKYIDSVHWILELPSYSSKPTPSSHPRTGHPTGPTERNFPRRFLSLPLQWL